MVLYGPIPMVTVIPVQNQFLNTTEQPVVSINLSWRRGIQLSIFLLPYFLPVFQWEELVHPHIKYMFIIFWYRHKLSKGWFPNVQELWNTLSLDTKTANPHIYKQMWSKPDLLKYKYLQTYCWELWMAWDFPLCTSQQVPWFVLKDTGKGHEIPGSEMNDSLVLTAITVTRVWVF